MVCKLEKNQDFIHTKKKKIYKYFDIGELYSFNQTDHLFTSLSEKCMRPELDSKHGTLEKHI
jgi:hypothetical protein